MTYKEALKYPLKLMEYKIIQKMIIYSMGGIFILLTLSQNINLIFTDLFTPIISGCENYKIEYTTTHKVYKIVKAILYDFLMISTFAWFLYKYKFCVFTFTAFYAVVISRIVWTTLNILGVEATTIDIATASILDFAWLTYLYYRIK